MRCRRYHRAAEYCRCQTVSNLPVAAAHCVLTHLINCAFQQGYARIVVDGNHIENSVKLSIRPSMFFLESHTQKITFILRCSRAMSMTEFVYLFRQSLTGNIGVLMGNGRVLASKLVEKPATIVLVFTCMMT